MKVFNKINFLAKSKGADSHVVEFNCEGKEEPVVVVSTSYSDRHKWYKTSSFAIKIAQPNGGFRIISIEIDSEGKVKETLNTTEEELNNMKGSN